MEVELFNSFKSRLMSFVFDFASQLFIPGNGVRENKIQDGLARVRVKKLRSKPANERKFIIPAKINQPEKHFMRFYGAFLHG